MFTVFSAKMESINRGKNANFFLIIYANASASANGITTKRPRLANITIEATLPE